MEKDLHSDSSIVSDSVDNVNSRKSRIPVIVSDREQTGSGTQGTRKRSLSRGGARGLSRGAGRGGGRASSRGPPPAKVAPQGQTPCPFCHDVKCPNPTRCALTYEWKSRLAVHVRKQLCPQYTCLKAHREKCWKAHTVNCSYCLGRHHIAWCKELAKNTVCSNTGYEPYESDD